MDTATHTTPFDAASMFDLHGKLAVVTGCRRGIGLAMAEALASAGADIVGVSANLEATGSEAARRVEALGRTLHRSPGRLRGSGRGRAACGHARRRRPPRRHPGQQRRHDRPQPRRSIHDTPTWDRVLEINLTAPFLLARALGRRMVERGAGKVIFTASLLSFQGGILVPSYTAAKSAVAGLVKALANEWAPHGVNVNGDRARIHRDRQHRGAAQRSRSQPRDPRAHPRRALGSRRPISLEQRCFSPPPRPTTCAATIIPVDGGWLAR